MSIDELTGNIPTRAGLRTRVVDPGCGPGLWIRIAYSGCEPGLWTPVVDPGCRPGLGTQVEKDAKKIPDPDWKRKEA